MFRTSNVANTNRKSEPPGPRGVNTEAARSALRRRLPDLWTVGVFSAAVNLLTLTGSFYMLQIYDRVLVSRSIETLVLLSIIALVAFALQGMLDSFRVRMLSRIGAQFDEELSPAAFRAATLLPLQGAKPGEATQAIRDTDQVRAFLGSAGPTALFDMPFMPIFVAGCFLLHPWLGWFAIGGGGVIVLLTFVTDYRTRGPVRDANITGNKRQVFSDAARRHSEAVDAMGMHGALGQRWEALSRDFRDGSLKASDIQSGMGAFAKIFRVILQSGILGLGAYLAVNQEISGGAMIAASIMTSRALAPIETAIANWKGFVGAREAYARLKTSLAVPAGTKQLTLPAPVAKLTVEGLTVAAPGQVDPILINANFELKAGDGLGIIGPSGSGKSSLARALVGVWRPAKGAVRLDGAMLEHWDRDSLGKHIGYLPQDLALVDGTVAETISRFQPEDNAERIIHAARAAGAHELILSLPEGYSTRIGDGGAVLSGGQRQRLGLARALYGDPFLVVLDEPNSNLDADGDAALTAAISAVRARGGIVVVVTHRPAGLASVDLVAFVADRGIRLFGPKDEVMATLTKPAEVTPLRRAANAGPMGSAAHV
ncbi:MAG: type secretion protein [Hyphomicrobiales bacterium]|nr:type secretion protein [Hyphomicrobiales bacterium]